MEAIYNLLTNDEQGLSRDPTKKVGNKKRAILEVVDIMYEFVLELIATFSLPQNERVKRIQDYVQRIGRTMIKDTGKNRPSKSELKQDISKQAQGGTPTDPELKNEKITRLKELKKDPSSYVEIQTQR